MPGRLILALAAFAAYATGGARGAVPGVPSIYVTYSQDCTFMLVVDPGTQITASSAPGQVLPPGTYDLQTAMPNPTSGYYPCSKPAFTLTGPGVNVSIVFPGQGLNDERLITLQSSSTYVALDTNAPSTSQRVFSTSATGSSTSLLPPKTPTTSKKGSTQTDIVGSAIVPFRGRMSVTVAPSGKATLELRGRRVGSLRAGRYEITVDDATPAAGFSLQRAGHRIVAVTTRAFVGRKTVQLTLAAGTWRYFTKPGFAVRLSVTG